MSISNRLVVYPFLRPPLLELSNQVVPVDAISIGCALADLQIVPEQIES